MTVPKRMKLLFILRILICCIAVSSCGTQALCAGNDNLWVIESEEPGGETYDLSEYGEKIGEIYRLAEILAIPCGAVAFAFGAFKMLNGDEKSMETGKRQMIFAAIAIAVVLLLPLAVRSGVDLGRQYGWSPP